MDEAAERRHRRRVIALAVFAGVCAALGTGWVTFWDPPQYFRSGLPTVYRYDWPFLSQDTPVQEDNVRKLWWGNFWKVAVPGAVIFGLFVGSAGYVVESVNPPGRRMHWILLLILWLVIWVAASIVWQFAISHLRQLSYWEWNSTGWQHMCVRGLTFGRNSAFLWLFPYLFFRRLDESDWVPTRRSWVTFALSVIVSACGATYYANRIAHERPQDVIDRVAPYNPNVYVMWTITKEA